MKQGSIGEYAIEVSARQGELKKVLMPHFAAAIGSRHLDKTLWLPPAQRQYDQAPKKLSDHGPVRSQNPEWCRADRS